MWLALYSSVLSATGCGFWYSLALDGASSPLTVKPRFETASDWNDYVLNDAAKPWLASGTACAATSASTFRDCLHAGELRVLTLPVEVTSCAGLAAVDELNVFDWVCVDGSGGTKFVSRGLRSGFGLRDLIDPATLRWKANSVIVTGARSLKSERTVWWPNNPVISLPDNSNATDAALTLSVPKAVYVTANDASTRGYILGADQLSLVTLGSSHLEYVGTPTAVCNDTTGLAGAANLKSIVCASRAYVWVEASLSSAGASLDASLYAGHSKFLRLLNSQMQGAWLGCTGPAALNAENLRLSSAGMYCQGLTGSRLSQLQVAPAGISLVNGSNGNVIDQVAVSSAYQGLLLQGSSNNVVSRVTILGTQSTGLELSGASNANNVFSMFTLVNTGHDGVGYYNGVNNVFHNFAILNSANQAFNIGGQGSFSQLAILNSQYSAVYSYGSNGKFSGALLVGPAGSQCQASGGTAPGINAACAGTDLSTGQLTTVPGVSAASTIVGKIFAEDTTNVSDTTGAAAAPGNWSFDYTHFDQAGGGVFGAFKLWGIDGGAFPADTNRGQWTSAGGAGRIWDLSLALAGTTLRNTTDDGSTPNADLVDDVPCPAWLAGSRILTDASGTLTYLKNAFELIGDGVGNDNGLCESNEACVATPNFGAYQGDGDFNGHSCQFADGIVAGVRMYYYPQNGR